MEVDEQKKNRLIELVSRKDSLMQREIAPETAKPIISLYLISNDIQEMILCIDSVSLLSRIVNLDNLTIAALWEKMIISYGKIFTNSKDGFSTLEAAVYFKEEMDLLLHQKIMNTRNSYIAHRGYNDYEYNIMLVDVIGNESNCHIQISAPGFKLSGHYFDPVTVRKHLKALLKKVNHQLGLKRDKLERNIYEELGLMANFD